MKSFLKKLLETSKKNNSLLCVGLDPILKSDPYLFSKKIIDKTHDLVCCYKPNMAFFEAYGLKGMAALYETVKYIHGKKIPVILDAKRSDIGHSAAAYAKAVFEKIKADAVTVNPLLGEDSVRPFLEYKDQTTFILTLTSNKGSADFQKKDKLYLKILKKALKWNKNKNVGLVVGATNPLELKNIRTMAKELPILIPGVGAQKGNLQKTVQYGRNKEGRLAIINASRSIIYAKNPRETALTLRDKINCY